MYKQIFQLSSAITYTPREWLVKPLVQAEIVSLLENKEAVTVRVIFVILQQWVASWA